LLAEGVATLCGALTEPGSRYLGPSPVSEGGAWGDRLSGGFSGFRLSSFLRIISHDFAAFNAAFSRSCGRVPRFIFPRD